MLTLTCKRATALLSAAMEGGLPLRERLLLRLHLRFCAACMRFKTQLLLLRRTIRLRAGYLEAQPSTHALPHTARARLKRALHNEKTHH